MYPPDGEKPAGYSTGRSVSLIPYMDGRDAEHSLLHRRLLLLAGDYRHLYYKFFEFDMGSVINCSRCILG